MKERRLYTYLPEENTAGIDAALRWIKEDHKRVLREFEEAENECGRKILKEMGLLKKEEK